MPWPYCRLCMELFKGNTHTHLLGAASIDINFLKEKTTPECCWYWQQCFPSHTVSCTQAFISTCSHHITVVIYCCAVLLHVVESKLVMCSSFHVLACSFEYWEIWKRRQSPENRRWKFTLINIYLQARLKQKATNPAHWVSDHSSFEHPPEGVIISRSTLSSNFLQILIFLLTLLTQKVGHIEACRRSPVCTTAIAGYQSELPACKDFCSLNSIFFTRCQQNDKVKQMSRRDGRENRREFFHMKVFLIPLIVRNKWKEMSDRQLVMSFLSYPVVLRVQAVGTLDFWCTLLFCHNFWMSAVSE